MAAVGADIDLDAGEVTEAILPPARRRWLRWRCGEQIAAERKLLGAMAIGEEADVADPVEAVGHGVLQEAADEFVSGERHHLGLAVLAIVFPGEADLAVVEPDQAAVGDGDAVSVAGEIAEHLLGPGERGLAVDDPIDLGQCVEVGGEGSGVGQGGESAGEAEFTGREGGAHLLQEQIAEAAREHAHGQEEAGRAGDPARLVGRDAAAGDDAVQMRMVVQRLPPGVQHRDRADLGAEVARVGGDAAQRLRRRAEQDGVDDRLVVERDLGGRRRQGKHDMEVWRYARCVSGARLRWIDSAVALKPMVHRQNNAPRSKAVPRSVICSNSRSPPKRLIASTVANAEVTVSAHLFRQDNSTLYLMRIMPIWSGQPATGVPDMKAKLVKVVEHAPDGFVVTRLDGRIITANAAFLEFAQLTSEEQARGEHLDRWLGQSEVDLNVLIANLRERGVVRFFSTSLRGEYGATAQVEVSAVFVANGDQACFGFAIRNVGSRIRTSMGTGRELPRSIEQLTELVGRVSLKDLVREATDVIERLCIEAALELTGDNRASAAEMLGLSRQSLYVKLRRYGLGDLAADNEGATDGRPMARAGFLRLSSC